MRRRLVRIVSGALGLALGLSAVAAASAIAADPYGVNDYDFALLHTDEGMRASADLLPPGVDLASFDEGQLDEATLRAVATTDEGEVFVALNAARELCLILITAGDDWAAASSCKSPGFFNSYGIGLRVQSPSTVLEGYVVSDRAAVALAKSGVSGLDRLGSTNAFVYDATVPEDERIELREALLTDHIGLVGGSS